jgi:hypothetical protein
VGRDSGKGSEDAGKVGLVMESVRKALNELCAGMVYQVSVFFTRHSSLMKLL